MVNMSEPQLVVETVRLLEHRLVKKKVPELDSWSVAMLVWNTVFEDNAKFTVCVRG